VILNAFFLETESRLCILDFLYGVLELNPLKRWTPQQAMQHPFITQKPYTGPFKPDGQINKPMSSISSSLANLSTCKYYLKSPKIHSKPDLYS
jgi:serine/threonine protein kinase